MITIIGPEETDEYAFAIELQRRISDAWPTVHTNDQHNIWIITSAKCYGQRVQDIDLLIFASLGEGFQVQSTKSSDEVVQVISFCCVVELKGHPPEQVQIVGNQVSVPYKGKWSNVSEQSHRQQVSLRNFLQQHSIIPPHVVNLIWLRNCPKHHFPAVKHNIVGGDTSWEEFVQRVIDVQGPFRPRVGNVELRAWRKDQEGFLTQAVNLFTHRIQPSRLDRKKMEQASERVLSGQQYSEKLGEQLLIFRGRGGTGKTATLLRLANELYQDQYARVLILTYNKALVSDIRRLLALMDIRDGVAERSIVIQTVHSFMYELLEGLGIITKPCADFFENYQKYKADALEVIGAIEPHDIQKLEEQNSATFSWDYIFIDEAQDWPEDERDLLFSVYNYGQFVVADGVDQLVRSDLHTDWRKKLSRRQTQVVTLKKSIRLKAGLCRFAQAFAHNLGLGTWEIEPNLDVHGGRVIIVEGPYSRSRALHDELIGRNAADGNAPVDMLFCVPPRLVSSDAAGHTYSLPGRKLLEWGFNIWDGSSKDIRDSYPTALDQLRIVQYDSCRGLEGWVVVNFELDQLFDYKRTTYEPTNKERNDLFFDQGKAAHDHAARWLMIPLTRAIDTLVIQITSVDHVVGQALKCAAESCSDFVEWRKTA